MNNQLRGRSSFTLIELLVVLALVAILSVVVVVTLNPAELIKQARDSNRLSDLSTINTALNLFSADVTSGFMGTSTIVYVSIPDNASSTCGSLGLPALPAGWNYNCVTTTNLRNTDGTGWIPVNFQRISSNSPISQLPVDPQNTTATRYYTYVAGGSWQLSSKMESSKYQATAYTSGGADPSTYTIGNNLSLAPFIGGLVGWWKFEEGSGTTAADSSGWGNNGAASGTAIVAGKVGSNARDFNATAEKITVANSPNLDLADGKITLIAWVKWAGGGNEKYIIDKFSNKYGLEMNGAGVAGTPRFIVNGGSVLLDNSSPLSIGVWHQLAATYDGSMGYSYVDSVAAKSISAPNQTPGTGGDLVIGCYQNCSASYSFSGSIDDVRIYNRALSPGEILSIYNATK